jgi:cell division transport system permease protein
MAARPARKSADRPRQQSPLLPGEDAREAALFFVIAALCFLAALAAIVSRAAYSAAQNWTSEVEGELSVVLRGGDARRAQEATDLVRATPGVADARLLPREEVVALVGRSFGTGGVPEGLPLPQLIAVTAAPDAPESLGATLQNALTAAGHDARSEDHSDWSGDVRRLLGAVRWAAIGAVALLMATAIAVIASATHANLLARRDVVEVLHLSGARDRFISQLFERRFWVMGLRAGAVGALFALGVAAILVFSAQGEGGRNWLVPRLSPALWDALILLMAPIVAALSARWTARVTVMRTLAGEA